MSLAFQIKTVRNCRNYLKKCYLLKFEVERKLLGYLEEYGELEINEFSKFSPLAKDAFRIRCFDELEISGALRDQTLYIVISKSSSTNIFTKIEDVISTWHDNKEAQSEKTSSN